MVGGGIAGCAVALAAHRAGLDAEVYEARADGGDDGAFLTLASNGMAALAQLDAAHAVGAAGFPLIALRLSDATGTEIACRPLDGHAGPLTRFRCLRRAGLCDVLRAEVHRRGVPIRFGARLVAVAEDDTGVTARFADGTGARGDLLVGADGLRSAVRAAIDPACPPPRYAGQRVYYGYTRRAAPPTAPGRIDMIRGGTVAFGYAVSPAGETFWYARVPGRALDPAEDLTPARCRETLLPLLRPDDTAAADIVAGTGDELMVTDARDLPAVPRWYTGRSLVVGDAAHAASPATGQGASMAIEDAVVLGKALRDAATTGAALAAYDRVRRPRVEANVAASARLTAGRPADRPRADTGPAHLDWHTPLPTG